MMNFASFITKFPRAFLKRSIIRIHFHQQYAFHNHPLRKMSHAADSMANTTASPSFRVNVTFRDMIKPSFPTPHHKKTVQFSIFDQLAPSFHTPIVLFYEHDPSNPISNHSKQSALLKKSLSETLVHFYPLAGRILDNVSIDCSDEGVEFCEAHVPEKLKNIIGNPNLNELKTLLPFQAVPRQKNLVLSVQVNYFACGGMALAICISHKIADGAASIEFLKAWATIAHHQGECYDSSGELIIRRPKFNAACLYPPSKDLNKISVADDIICNYKTASKRLIFDHYKIIELKLRARVSTNTNNPTKVEVVSGFIWEQLLKVAAIKPNFTKISAAIVVTDLRARLEPPIQEATFGNFTWHATSPRLTNDRTKLPELVNKLRKGIKLIDNKHMEEGLLRSNPSVAELKKMVSHEGNKCVFSSLCKFPLYEVNFGTGEPVWACVTPLPVKSEVFVQSTKCGRGVEAWIHMLEDDIVMLDDFDDLDELCHDDDEPLSRLGYPMLDPVLEFDGNDKLVLQ